MNKWLKLSIIMTLFVIIPVVLFICLRLAGFTSMEYIKQIIRSTGRAGVITYIFIQTAMLVLFCFVPVLNTSLVIVGIVLFGPKTAFFSCMICIFLSSTTLFYIGEKFGEKLIAKIIGLETLTKIQNSIDTKSKLLLPIFFIIPGVPDEALCLVTGMTKIKYYYFIIVSLVYHAIEIGMFCFFGSELIDWSSLNTLGWIIVVNIFIIDFVLISKFEKWLENKLNNKKDNK